MILRTDAAHVRIVLQTDHATIAAELARRWAEDFQPHAAVVLAAAMHDEGWRIWESAPDGLRSFLRMDPAVHAAFYAAGVDRVERLDRDAAVLCSLHASGLYNGAFGARQAPPETAVGTALLAAEEARRARLGPVDDNMWRNYRLLQTWDQLALVICGHPLSRTAGGLAVVASPMGRVTIAPWPFREGEVALAVPYRRLPAGDWSDGQAFRQALADAPWEANAVVLAPGP